MSSSWFATIGRVHSLVTRLPRLLRPTLHSDSRPLVSVDVHNSQPLILGHVVRKEMTKCAKWTGVEGGGSRETGRGKPGGEEGTLHTMSIHSDKCIVNHDRTGGNDGKPDWDTYISLCERGEFYEFMQSLGGIEGIDRSRLKRKCFTEIFYARNSIVTPLTVAFARNFPAVMRVIRNAKRTDHTLLAKSMQRDESDIIIAGACGRLMKEAPHIPVLTIHDSLMTSKDHVNYVASVMRQEFEHVGLHPTLNIEQCIPCLNH